MSEHPSHQPITDVLMVEPKAGMDIIIVDRIEVGPFGTVVPEYCIHGKTTCYGCNEWCWLGDKTHEVMRAGNTLALCIECATKMLPKDARPKGNLHDHRRADGPH